MNWTEQDLQAYFKRRGVSEHTAAKIVLRVKEKDFQAAVKDMALVNGWRYYHTHDSRRSDEGFPDCVMVHSSQKRLIFAELKIEGKDPSSRQQDWLDDLTSVAEIRPGQRFEIYLWHPSDVDEIWQILCR